MEVILTLHLKTLEMVVLRLTGGSSRGTHVCSFVLKSGAFWIAITKILLFKPCCSITSWTKMITESGHLLNLVSTAQWASHCSHSWLTVIEVIHSHQDLPEAWEDRQELNTRAEVLTTSILRGNGGIWKIWFWLRKIRSLCYWFL